MSTSASPNPSTGRGLWNKVRNGRLTSTFASLLILTVGILVGSLITSKVSGKEAQKVDSSDARPLTIPTPVTLSNGFSQIAKQVGPAVVNINTESMPKQSATPKRNRRGATPQAPDGGGDQGDMQDFFNRFFGGQGGGGGDDDSAGQRRALGSG